MLLEMVTLCHLVSLDPCDSASGRVSDWLPHSQECSPGTRQQPLKMVPFGISWPHAGTMQKHKDWATQQQWLSKSFTSHS